MNAAQQALELLRNQMTDDDLAQLSDDDLRKFEANCYHWMKMAEAERKKRNTAA